MSPYDFCEKAIGLPWENRAEEIDRAVDCFGLVLESYRHIDGIELPQVPGYANPDTSTEDAARGCNQLACYQPSQPCDGAIMALFNTKGDITHVGRCLCGRVLHATSALGVRWDTYGAITQRYGSLVRYFKYVT